MFDEPRPDEMLAAVAAFLREPPVGASAPHRGFQSRVAANAVDLVARQIDLAPAADAAELERLRALLGQNGTLFDLNTLLARRIAEGTLDVATPAVSAHLRATTLAKLAVDQPGYSGYRAAVAKDA